MFARADRWASLDPLQKAAHAARALARLHPSWVFCGPTAGLLHGLWVSFEQVAQVNVVGRSRGGERALPWLRRHEVGADEVAQVDGVRVTSFWRTVFDCVRTSDFRRALAVADSALKATGLTHLQMAELLTQRYRWHPDVRRVADVCAHADARSDNGGESVARAGMISQGFSLPSLQVRVTDDWDGGDRRIDFVWMGESGRLGFGELDGGCKYVEERYTGGRSVAEVLLDERRRESRMSVYHPSWVRFSYSDVMDVPRLVGLLGHFGIGRGDPPRRPHGVPLRADGMQGYAVLDEMLFRGCGMTVLATMLRPA